jgi:hypothetical protein
MMPTLKQQVHRTGQPSTVARSAPLVMLFCILLCILSSVTVLMAQAPGGQAPKLTPLPHPEIALPAVPEEAKPVGHIIVAVFGAFVLMGLIAWLLLRKSRLQPPPVVSASQIALNRLAALKEEADTGAPAVIASRVSVILREFQEAGFAVPAPYRTSDELFHKAEPALQGVLKERFSPVAAFYDRLSFAPQPATKAEASELIDNAIAAVSDEKVGNASIETLKGERRPDEIEAALARTGTKMRQLRFLTAWAFVALAVFTWAMTWTEKLSAGGQFTAAVVGLALVLVSVFFFRQALNTHPEETGYRPPVDAPVSEHISYHRYRLILCLIAFPVLSAVTIYQLNLLEHHSARQVTVWVPVAAFYKLGGYWPGVFVVPLLGLWASFSHLLNLRRVLKIASPRT